MTEDKVAEIVDKRLAETLDKKLDSLLDEKLDAKLDAKFQQYGLLIFKRFDELYREMDRRFDEVDRKFSKLQSAVDGMAARLDTEIIERTALEMYVDRHDRWIKTIAAKSRVKLE